MTQFFVFVNLSLHHLVKSPIVSNAGINQSQPVWMEDSRTLLFEAKDLDSGVCQFVVGNVSSDKGVLVSEGECVRFFDLHIWHLP